LAALAGQAKYRRRLQRKTAKTEFVVEAVAEVAPPI
jgi:hypothetical protein